jgi:hypothetical protein
MEVNMTGRTILMALLVLGVLGAPTRALADDDDDDRPCEVKIESKRGEFKREVKCKDGVGARWHGEWEDEFWDGPCKVKLTAKRDELKEEVKCEGR